MPAKKKTQIDQHLESVREKPIGIINTEKQDQLIRDLVAIIRANLPGREYVVLAQAERYLKEKENG